MPGGCGGSQCPPEFPNSNRSGGLPEEKFQEPNRGKKLAQKHLKLAFSYIVPGSRPAASYQPDVQSISQIKALSSGVQTSRQRFTSPTLGPEVPWRCSWTCFPTRGHPSLAPKGTQRHDWGKAIFLHEAFKG